MALAVTAVLAGPTAPAEAEEGGKSRGTGKAVLSQRIVTGKNGTSIWHAAWPTWGSDTARETKKERNYWSEFRRKEKARLLGMERARTARIIAAARARGAAYGAFARTAKTGDAPPTAVDRKITLFPDPDGTAPAPDALTSQIARGLGDAASSAKQTTQSLTKSIGESLPAASSTAASAAGTIAALLIIFLLPAFAVTLLALGVVKLRRGRRP